METYRAKTQEPLIDLARARAFLKESGLAAIVVSTDTNLFYVSGHASDATLCHFFDRWTAAVLPASDGEPGTLVIPEYELAYQLTDPTWLPELRAYGTEWSGASQLLNEIDAGAGLETELRAPLRELVRRTRPTRRPDLLTTLADCVGKLGSGPLRVGFDDLRLGATLRATVGDRLEVADALPVLRRIRAVKTAPEIAILREAALINEDAVQAAAAAIREGGRWGEMVVAYRSVLARRGAKPLGERGMLFGAGPDGAFVLSHDYVESKTFNRGDAVILDAIAEYRLYRADMARTAIVGTPASRHRELHAIVTETLAAVEAKMRPGTHTGELEALAKKTIEAHGLDSHLTTLLVHPIGLEVFDFATPEEAAHGFRLEANAVVNFEVFYRDPRWGGMHLEDSVVIRPAGIERLSRSGRDLLSAS
jgi:Xaa-Pro dipeptidase